MLPQKIKNSVFEFAERTIVSEGVNKINISNMCMELGISKKTFYKYFGSKHNFIHEFYFEKLGNVYFDLIAAIQRKDSFADKIITISNIIQKNISIFSQKQLYEFGEKHPLILEEINEFKNKRIIPLFYLMIRKAQKHNIVTKYNTSVLFNVFFSVLFAIEDSNQLSLNGNKIELKDVFHLLLNGILTKKGKNFLNNKLVNIN